MPTGTQVKEAASGQANQYNSHYQRGGAANNASLRYESADNRAKHQAIVNHQIQKRKGNYNDETEVEDFGASESDGFNRVSLKTSQQHPNLVMLQNQQNIPQPSNERYRPPTG